jgi:hypothetical protein
MTFAPLVQQSQLISDRLEAIGIIAHEHLGSHTGRNGVDPRFEGGSILCRHLVDGQGQSPPGYRPSDTDATIVRHISRSLNPLAIRFGLDALKDFLALESGHACGDSLHRLVDLRLGERHSQAV